MSRQLAIHDRCMQIACPVKRHASGQCMGQLCGAWRWHDSEKLKIEELFEVDWEEADTRSRWRKIKDNFVLFVDYSYLVEEWLKTKDLTKLDPPKVGFKYNSHAREGWNFDVTVFWEKVRINRRGYCGLAGEPSEVRRKNTDLTGED